jgi:alpha-2-macroglobulin
MKPFSRVNLKDIVKIFINSLFLFTILIVANSCQYFNSVKLKAKNFGAVVNLTENLVFSLNENLSEADDFGHWFTADFIDISPNVAGKFKWKDEKTLIFSPSERFAPATTYKIALNPTAKKYLKTEKNIDPEPIVFNTPAPKVEKTTLFWTKSLGQPDQLMAKINFNYAPNTTDYTKYISLTSDKKAIDFEPQKSLENNALLLKIKSDVKENEPFEIQLNKSINIANHNLEADHLASLNVPDKALEIIEVSSDFDEGVGSIKVITNAEIKAESIYANVAVESSETLANGKPKILPFKYDMMDNGFLIRANFESSYVYTLKIKKALESKLATKLEKDYTQEVVFGERPSEINFTNKKGIYLSANGFKNIAVQITSTPKVEVKIAQLFENNVLTYIKNSRNRNYNYDYEEEDGGESTASAGFNYDQDRNEDYSNLLLNRKFDTRGLPKNGGSAILNINQLEQNKKKGVFLVSVVSEENYWVKDTRLVSISDIGLITKVSSNSLLIFANSIHTSEPIAEVDISLVSTNNQLIITKKTDKDGVVVFDNLKETLGNYKIGMVSAKTNDDFNFMVLDGSEVETSRFEIEGKHQSNTGFDAFIYGDRNIYRPGETLNFVAVLRDEQWKANKDIPLKARLLMPNGKEYFSGQKSTNEQGAVEFNIPTQKSSVTGLYTFEILNGNDVLLQSKSVNLEEFMPDRVKVDVKLNKEYYSNNEPINISAQVNHMFGPPAIGLNYEMEMRLDKAEFKAKKYPGYNFEIDKAAIFVAEVHEGKTDAIGIAKQTMKSHLEFKDMGMLEAKLFVTVFDESARPVNRLRKFNIYTQSTFFGIKTTDSYVGTNTPVKFDLIALDKDQQPVSASPMVEIVQNEYQTILEKNDGGFRYVSKKTAKSIIKRKTDFANGKAQFSFTPLVSGDYEVRVCAEGGATFTSQNFYAYTYGNTQSTAFEVNNEGNVEISFDKEKYTVGETVTALFKTPFAGKMLVTVEKNKVFEYHYINTDQKSAELKFKLTTEQLPNFYVSATLFRPMNKNYEMPLTVAHGYSYADVEDKKLTIPVSIVAVQKSRANTHQKVTVKTATPNAYVSIAVVDEGILQLKNFRTPEINQYFYQKHALDVKSFDIYPFLFPEIEMSNLEYTGGDGYNLEKRVNPLSNGRVELVSKWSGLIKTNGVGEANFEFDIPQFTGDLRIMAVAFKDNTFGSAEANMLVADPVVINTSIPRFLSPGDQWTMPVTIQNTTGTSMKATVITTTNGGIKAIGPSKTNEIMLPANMEVRTSFTMQAPTNAADAEVIVTVAASENFVYKTKISVRQPLSLIKTFTTGTIDIEKTETINLSKDFQENTASHQMILSRSPLVKMSSHIANLLGYPHGCVEQTVSKAFPQLYFADFAKEINYNLVSNSKKSDFNPNRNVQLAIDGLESFATPEGGLSYWQGMPNANGWATAYGAHFLVESKKAGYDVKNRFLKKTLAYLISSSNTDKPEQNINYYNANGQVRVRSIAKPDLIYNLYVLALADAPQKSLMNYYKNNLKKLTVTEQYLLAATFKIIGDNAASQAIMPKSFNEEKQVGNNFSDFYSPIRNLALSLNALLESDPQNLQIPLMVRQLSSTIEKTKTLNTQEQSYAFLALGKYAKTLPESKMTASVSSNGKALANYAGKLQNYGSGLAQSVNISTKGKGELYYFIGSEGLSKSGKVVEEDKNLIVRRQYYTRDGKPIINNIFSQNQLIVVKVTLKSVLELPIKNVVITDILPAGLEIENPRISGERGMAWIKNQSTPNHFDIRDDRINLFTDAGPNQEYYYLARAVSKGKFTLGPISADAMYSAEARSYNGAGVVTVQ